MIFVIALNTNDRIWTGMCDLNCFHSQPKTAHTHDCIDWNRVQSFVSLFTSNVSQIGMSIHILIAQRMNAMKKSFTCSVYFLRSELDFLHAEMLVLEMFEWAWNIQVQNKIIYGKIALLDI